MGTIEHLPASVARLIQTRFICEFATVSREGVPIDTPLVPFCSDDLDTVDAATGLAYPAKAERLRRNPKCGMLFEGGPDDPVVLVSAMGGVSDRDFQANLERYLSEEILTSMLDPAAVDYAEVTRHAIWYFTRIVMRMKPAVVRWWPDRAALDGDPQVWRAPPGTEWPRSDAPPSGKPAPPPWSEAPRWQDLADGALARKATAHLTLLDDEGYPLPLRALLAERTPEGFRLALPGWTPWRDGKATVTFEGIETFVGTAELSAGEARFISERALPILPLMADPVQILRPSPETRAALMGRIEHELARRDCRLPEMPESPPEPTRGARLRAESAFAFSGFASG